MGLGKGRGYANRQHLVILLYSVPYAIICGYH